MTIGERIIQLREQRNMTQYALAKAAGIPRSTLNSVERGSRSGERLSLATARRLARALGVTIDDLAGTQDDDEEDAA
jgi:putative transcriptional regulator